MKEYLADMFGPNLYLVAVAICGIDIDPDRCGPWTTTDFHRSWFYRPNLEACASFAEDMLEKLDFDPINQTARVFCMRAETPQEAYQYNVP